jgi:nucleotide-binding universal stress UspA family protein
MTWFSKKKLVVPVDFSEPSVAAVNEALGMADSPALVHIVHVIQESVAVAPEFAVVTFDLEAQMRDAKQALVERFQEGRYRGLVMDVRYGDPGIEIAEYAGEVKADLIVMPSHGRRGLKRLLIGSVAERVVRLAHCPVLVLKT